jgi:hypothetical protein
MDHVARTGRYKYTKYWSEDLKGRDRSEDLKIDERAKECEVVDWIRLAQRRVQWPALVNAEMNLRVT